MKQSPPRTVKFRHKLWRALLGPAVYVLCRLRYGIKLTRFREDQKRPYLILYNHQTDFDQFFASLIIKAPVYHVASDDLFSKGFVSKLITYLVAPIPIKKQATDIAAIKQCLRVAREGGSIAMSPEGNRTFSGRTEYMSPTVAPLARRMKLPILLLRIEGGYGVHPRWSNFSRRGKMQAYVARVIEPLEYATLSDTELFELIRTVLDVDETKNGEFYRHKRRAENLERVLYICPHCGPTHFHSKNETVSCQKCGRRVIYHENKQLTGDGFDLPFTYVADWYDYQKDHVNSLDLGAYTKEPLWLDNACVSEVIPCKKKCRLLKNAPIALYGDRVTMGAGEKIITLAFDDILAASVLGRNKLNLYHKDRLYQFKGDKSFNAIKYVNLYYRHKNMKKETDDGKFLGL